MLRQSDTRHRRSLHQPLPSGAVEQTAEEGGGGDRDAQEKTDALARCCSGCNWLTPACASRSTCSCRCAAATSPARVQCSFTPISPCLQQAHTVQGTLYNPQCTHLHVTTPPAATLSAAPLLASLNKKLVCNCYRWASTLCCCCCSCCSSCCS